MLISRRISRRTNMMKNNDGLRLYSVVNGKNKENDGDDIQ